MPDEQTIYFTSTRASDAGDFDIFVATRLDKVSAFGPAEPVAALVSSALEDRPSPSHDGLELFFSRATVGVSGSYEILVARRASRGASFGAPESVLKTGAAEFAPFVVDNGDVFFASDTTSGRSFDLFRLPRLADRDAGFAAAQPIDDLNTAALEADPVLSFDQMSLYFQSSRTGANGDTQGDIWVAHRSSPSASFDTPVHVSEVNAAATFDGPSWLSPDNCRLYMSSARSGPIRIYVATRRP